MKKTLIVLCLLAYGASAHAEYGLALGATARYGAGFTHYAYANPDAPKGGVLTLSANGRFDALNPFTLKGAKEVGMEALTVETLCDSSLDEPFAMYGLLADDVRVDKDGLGVTFHLNPKARFHNGEAVTAADVVASFNILTQDAAASPMYRFYWADVKRAVALDAATVHFEFKNKNAELHMILGQLPVFSRKSFPEGLAHAAGQTPIGSGPYRLRTARDGRLSEYQRDANYWAEDLPVRRGLFNFDVIRYKYYQDETARVEALKAHEYDLINENVARLWARAYQSPSLEARGLKRTLFAHQNDAGMQGFVFNLRRGLFQDVRLRQAVGLAFDFETVNRLLFYGQYARSDSYFTNSDLAASGLPESAEKAMLSPWAQQLANVLNHEPVRAPTTDAALGVRPNLIQARNLLLAAGYRYQDGHLVTQRNEPVRIEFLSPSKTYERVGAKWQRDLAKIGIELTFRIVDPALYQKRMNDFDFDMTIVNYPNSQSPGNEQKEMYSCEAAKTPGSQNYAGLCDPVIEGLLPHFSHYADRNELVSASHALDRVLRSKYLVVPNWYTGSWRMVYWSGFRQPQTLPKYYEGASWAVRTWWKG